MTFAQPLPWWVLGLAAALIIWVAWRAGWTAGAHAGPPAAAWQRVLLAGLRVVAGLALLAIVMRPVRLVPDPTGRGAFAVLIDVSRSMSLTDASGGSRLEAAKAVVRDRVVPAISDRLALEVLAFGDEAQGIPVEQLSALSPTSPQTDVAAGLDALRRRAGARPLAGVLVVSDGGFVLPEADAAGANLGAPVHALGVGGTQVERDREIRDLTAGEAGLAGATVDLVATVASTGYGAEPMEVRLLANGRPMDVRRVEPAGEGVPTEVAFRVAPDAQTATLYTVDVPPQEGELTTENNRRSLLIPPPGRARRVLLLEGAPGFEHSFLKRAIDQDEALEVDAVVRKGANERGEPTFYVQADAARAAALTSGFPASRASLFAYDALVLANVAADAFSRDQLALVADYVGERGGGLLVLGARSLEPAAAAGTALEELLPLDISDRRAPLVARAERTTPSTAGVVLTPDGETHPVMRLGATVADSRDRWAHVPKLAAVASVGAARPGATVLAYTSGPGGLARPLVAVQRYGRGRVMVFAGEAAWRWRMMLPSSDTTYPTFWRQAARWLAATSPDPVSVRTKVSAPDRLEVFVDVRDDAFQAVRDAEVEVEVRSAGGAIRAVTAVAAGDADGYRAELRVPSGVTRVDVRAAVQGAERGRATTWALAGPDGRELIEPRRNDAQLARLAERFDGRLVTVGDIGRVLEDASARGASATTFLERDVWPSTWVLLVLMTLLVGEWSLRRRWGLR